MEITYRLIEEDYVKFNLFHVRNSPTSTKTLKVQRYLIPAIYLVISVLFLLILNPPAPVLGILFLVTGILWFVFYPKYYYGYIKRQVKKMMKEGKNEDLLGNQTIIFTEEGLHKTGFKGETKLLWSGIERLGEDDANLYLYNSAVSAIILPKRKISNLDEFKSYLQARIGSPLSAE
jgi:hypothetical protein